MVRVSVVKKSTRAASTSATSTARSAKASQNAVDTSWSDHEGSESAAQGWGVYECVDEKTTKVFFEIQTFGTRFKHDEAARVHVAGMAKGGDALALKALRIVFRSKVSDKAKGKK